MNSPHKITRRPKILFYGAEEQILFSKRLGMILRSGMPIVEGLHMLRDNRTRSSSYIIDSLITDVSEGRPLSSGIEKFQNIFGEFTVNIIRVGEASGTLHENLDYLSEELNRKRTLRRKVHSALVYPAIIVGATVGITILLTIYIFPKIVPIFKSVKATLPGSTRALMAISDFLQKHGFWLLIGFGVGCVLYMYLLRKKRFHIFVDRVLLLIPLFSKISRSYNLANISRTLSLLLKSDVRIVPAIELVAASTRNLVFREALMAARERLLHGQKLSEQFRHRPRLFPPLFDQMVAVGESTGNLSGTLSYLSNMYEEDLTDMTRNLANLLEPALMIIMGLIVGFIAISIITPIYSITQNLNAH